MRVELVTVQDAAVDMETEPSEIQQDALEFTKYNLRIHGIAACNEVKVHCTLIYSAYTPLHARRCFIVHFHAREGALPHSESNFT